MEKRAATTDLSSFSLFFLMDFLSLPTIFNWVYFTLSKFISRSVSRQMSFTQKTSIRDKKEEENLTTEGVKALMENLGISCSGARDDQDDEQSLDSSHVLVVFDEKEPSLDEVKEAFDVFDMNRDGFIDSTELQRVLRVLGLEDVGSSLERCKMMIKCFDVNNDGRIDFDEFVKLMETTFC